MLKPIRKIYISQLNLKPNYASWFAQDNMFSSMSNNNGSSNTNIHIYPAINSLKKLVILMINIEKDLSTNTALANDVPVCSVFNG